MSVSKILAVLVISASAVLGVSITELDDFNSPEGAFNPHESWREGDSSTSSPFQRLTGGPDGSGFLMDWSTGSSPGRNLQLWNTDQWTGDYLGQSIGSLLLDAVNLSEAGGETIHLRVAFNGPGGWFVTDPQVLLPESGWQSLLFDISIGGLVHAGDGDESYDSTMSAVERMQIISLEDGAVYDIGGNSGLRGQDMVATLGLDNIQAGGGIIPEPSRMVMVLLGSMGLLRRRREFVKNSAIPMGMRS